ncbi:hypothetical protein ACIBCO_40195 [Streptomyces violascens]|uniref:hypothetical protein n=1 Tax=Streptomyces violascens TaxID=67381 RepID=UPI0037A62EBA
MTGVHARPRRRSRPADPLGTALTVGGTLLGVTASWLSCTAVADPTAPGRGLLPAVSMPELAPLHILDGAP